MSNLTDLLPAGAGGKQVSFAASGTIGNGVTVVLNSNGTVSVVTGSPQVLGSEVIFETTQTGETSCAFDSNSNKVVIAYRDEGNSNYGTAVVGTVSGTSISFGTPVVYESAYVFYPSAVFDSNSNKIVVAYRDLGNGSYGTAIVGTVSGTSISFGSPVVFNAGRVFFVSATFDSNSNKVVVAYADDVNSDYGTAIVGTVSGTSISFGSEVVFNTAYPLSIKTTFDSNSNKVVIAYKDNGNSSYGTAIVGTVSGTSISFGSESVFEAASTDEISIDFDSTSNKIVIAYRDEANSNYGTAVVGTVSGTSISFGTPVVFESATVTYTSTTFDPGNNKVVISYRDDGNSNYGTLIVGTVSGTSISFESPVVFNAGNPTSFISSVYDPNAGKVVIAYRDSGVPGAARVLQNGSTNNTDFIGISDAAISDTASGSVTIKGGISTNVTGLTPNATYYVQTDGSLSTTTSTVLAGKALSSTSINLDYTT